MKSISGSPPTHDAHVVCLDADWPAIAQQPATAPATNLAPQHPAYVIYTSRSTGTGSTGPKGVAVTHSGIPNLAAAHIDRLAIAPGSRILQFASLSFDAAASEIATALASGAALVLPAAERSGDALAHLIREQRVTHALLPPVVASLRNNTSDLSKTWRDRTWGGALSAS